MSLSRPEENEKKFFIKEFQNLLNWYPHLTLQESINLTNRTLEREKKQHPHFTKLKKWLHPDFIK